MVKKTIRTYNAISFLFQFGHSFFFATYVLFLNSFGLNLFQVNFINVVYMASVFLFEIPTGAFADIFGRKKSVILGFWIYSASMFIYFASDRFWLFVLAEAIGALASTFVSGALQAWAVDSLKHHEFEGELREVTSRSSEFGRFGVIIGTLIGSWAGKHNLALPWLLSSVAMFSLGATLIFWMREDYLSKERPAISWKPIGKIARDSIVFGWQKKSILYVISFAAVLAFAVQPFNMFWPLTFTRDYRLDIATLGWVFMGMQLALLAGNRLALRFHRLVGNEKNAIIFSQSITSLGMIGAAQMFGFPVILVLFLGHELGRGIFGPLSEAYLNKRIPGDKRATVLSFASMIEKGGATLGLLISGYLAERYSISFSWLVMGIALMLAVLIFPRLKNGDK